MYLTTCVFLYIIYFDYPTRWCIFVISLHFVPYFLMAPRATKDWGTKLFLGIMFKNKIIVLTTAVHNYVYCSITNFRLDTVIIETTKYLVGIRCGCKCSCKSFQKVSCSFNINFTQPCILCSFSV